MGTVIPISVLFFGFAFILYAANEGVGSVFHSKLGFPFRKSRFAIRIDQVWYSEEYVYLEYTNNHGFTWHRIIDSQTDYSVGFGYKKSTSKTWKIYDGLKQNLKDKFSDVEKCREFLNKHEYDEMVAKGEIEE